MVSNNLLTKILKTRSQLELVIAPFFTIYTAFGTVLHNVLTCFPQMEKNLKTITHAPIM